MKKYGYIYKQYILKNLLFWGTGLILPALFTVMSKVLIAKMPEDIVTELENGVVDIKLIILIAVSLFLGAAVAEIVVSIFRFVIVKFTIDCENEKKNEIFSRILRMRNQKFKDLNTGEIIVKYNKDVRASVAAISLDLEECVYPIIIAIGYCLAIMLRQLYVGLVVLVIIVAVTLLNWLYINKFKKIERQLLHSKENYTQQIEFAYSGKMMIRLLNLQDNVNKSIDRSANLIAENDRKRIKLTFIKALCNDTLIALCSVMVIPVTCVLASFKIIKLPEVLFIANLCSSIMAFTGVLANSLIQMQKDSVSLGRIVELLELEQEKYEIANSEELNDKNAIMTDEDCIISLRGVSINYENKNILKNVYLDIHKGEIVALVGKSGTGKSTLLKSILQLIDYEGDIYVYNKNILNLPVNQLRSVISYILEDNDLFAGTIESNVRYGNITASDKAVIHAMTMAGLMGDEHTDIDIKMKVGMNGERISGGQKQRISIARGFLKNSDIILMDEPTAALDPIIEKKIMSQLEQLAAQGKSIILTSHRLSTIEWASRIVMVKEKQIIDNVSLEEVKKFLYEEVN